jgi:hypothetical protein
MTRQCDGECISSDEWNSIETEAWRTANNSEAYDKALEVGVSAKIFESMGNCGRRCTVGDPSALIKTHNE